MNVWYCKVVNAWAGVVVMPVKDINITDMRPAHELLNESIMSSVSSRRQWKQRVNC